MVSYVKPITRSEALRQGYTDKELRGPRFQRLFQGVYLPSGVRVNQLHRALAALLVAPPGAYVSHHTAAALWGGIVPDTEDTHISVPGEATRSIRRGIFAHRADPAVIPIAHRGVPTAPPLASFLQLASLRLDLVALVVLGDSLVRRKRVTPERLVEAAAQWNGKGRPPGPPRSQPGPSGRRLRDGDPGPAADRAGRAARATGQLHRAR